MIKSHPISHKNNGGNRSHNRHQMLIGPAVLGLLCLIAFAPPFQALDNRLMDVFSILCPPAFHDSPIILVGIDEPSFQEIGLQWPWPRSLHARLIDRLTAAGASVIAMDIVFAEPSSPSSDQAMTAAIQRAGNVVLATEETLEETAYVSQLITVPPLDLFTSAGAETGVATVTLDPDGLMRRLPLRQNGFALTVFDKWRGINHVPSPGEPVTGQEKFLQFFGPSRTYPYVSYYQALEPDRFLPPNIFQNRVVIVGWSIKTPPAPYTRPADMFITPFTWDSKILTAGIEINATIFDNLRLRIWFQKLPSIVYFSLLAVFVFLAGLLFKGWEPAKSFALVLAICAAIICASFAILKFGRIWISPALFMLAALLYYAIAGGRAYLRERADRRFIKDAFSRYLSSALVDQLASDPSRLILGGETRQMTVMFCDVRGFTSISERFSSDPQGLTQLMNRFFTIMTGVILRNSGTVDKYIGDCIMAFWNAPVDDPNHACHACAAALDMTTQLRRMNREWSEEAASKSREPVHLGIGIGINTGSCVAGNFGSEQRFDYSVLGDPVNLASRLEGQSKTYGVEIVIGPETAAAAADYALLELDLIAVKGKKEAVRVYTVMGDPAYQSTSEFQGLSACHQKMIGAYRRRDWAEARALLLECRRLGHGLERLYNLYQSRIAEYEISPRHTAWDGVYIAKTK